MEITKTLRKPSNWQDFEKLCWMLWREEWQCPDLIKNGRNGQNQHGVDLSGHRNGEIEYCGIQCKCKPGDAPLTTAEIDMEIQNAMGFNPPLKHLIFATTADKDVKIEEYIRKKDIENIENGVFSISIKSWSDIVDLMDIHLSVRRNYESSMAISTQYAAKLTFVDNSECLVCMPQYKQTYYRAKRTPEITAQMNTTLRAFDSALSPIYAASSLMDKFRLNIPIVQAEIIRSKTNHSYNKIQFILHNTGNCTLDQCTVKIHFECSNIELVRTNTKSDYIFDAIKIAPSRLDLSSETGTISFYIKSIVPKDTYTCDSCYFKAPYNTDEILVKWTLLSRDFNCEGELLLKCNPKFEYNTIINDEKAGEEVTEDYITTNDKN